MNFYISGQSGFIGQAITKYLLEKGENVLNIPRVYTIDGLRREFDKDNPDYIIHLASYGNHYYQTDQRQMIETNFIGTFNLLEAAKGYDYKIFYNMSPSSVMLEKQTSYSLTKHLSEQLCWLYERTRNIRPYSVYGVGDAKHKFIPRVIECLHTGESMVVDIGAVHDWIYISDLIDALFSGETKIGTGIGATNGQVIELLETISGKKLNYTCGKVRNYDTDNWIALRGVKHISLYDGLKLTYEGYL